MVLSAAIPHGRNWKSELILCDNPDNYALNIEAVENGRQMQFVRRFVVLQSGIIPKTGELTLCGPTSNVFVFLCKIHTKAT